MIIKVLGPGCKNCVSLKDSTLEAVKQMGLDIPVIKVQDFKEIAAYGVMQTPALVIDEKVVSFGKVLKPAEIIKIIKKFI
jgi:small redox-active disulfide protein 2